MKRESSSVANYRAGQGQKPDSAIYKASYVKPRTRRTRDQMDNFLAAILGILAGEEGQITIRHLFYRATVSVGLGVIPKVENAYQQLIQHLSKWRRSGDIKWNAFADSTRWHIQSPTFDSMDDALANTVATYRRNLWQAQKFYVEVWCEKDAVAGILAKAADPFGVPIFVARGFASLSSLYNAANTFRDWSQAGKKCMVYHFGDFDPSGVAAGESMLRSFRDDFKVDVEFIRAAVTRKQILQLKLPTRPVKTSDTRAAKWTGGECVELDSMPPAEIRKLVESCITRHIEPHQWAQTQAIEKAERETLRSLAQTFKGERYG